MMKIAMACVLLLATWAAPVRADEGTWTPLFNGRDLTGWETWLARPPADVAVAGLKRDASGNYREDLGLNADPLHVFEVVTVEGAPALRISGQVFGVIATVGAPADYHLRLHFKWGDQKWAPRLERPRDSGLCYHVHGPYGADGGTFPRCTELQIEERDCGDLWALGTRATARARPKVGEADAVYDPTQAWEFFGPETRNEGRCIKLTDAERPQGEWNEIELLCVGDESIHVVNGQVVLRLARLQRRDGDTWARLDRGKIALQSEGAEIFYRAIEIRPLAQIPAQYR